MSSMAVFGGVRYPRKADVREHLSRVHSSLDGAMSAIDGGHDAPPCPRLWFKGPMSKISYDDLTIILQ